MKQQDHLYNTLTERLHKAQPQPSSPEALTARIMDNIRHLPQQQVRRSQMRQLKRILSGLAAVIVMSLLVYEIARPTGIAANKYIPIKHYVTPPHAPATYTRTEKIKLYLQWKQAQQKRQEEKRNSLISLKYKYTRS